MHSILGNTRKADFVFHSSGQIEISSSAAKILSLKQGDVIDVMVSGDDYYLYIRHHSPTVGHHECSVFKSNKGGHHFRAWSKKLCASILDNVPESGQRARLCAGAPVRMKHYGIALPIIIKYILP